MSLFEHGKSTPYDADVRAGVREAIFYGVPSEEHAFSPSGRSPVEQFKALFSQFGGELLFGVGRPDGDLLRVEQRMKAFGEDGLSSAQ